MKKYIVSIFAVLFCLSAVAQTDSRNRVASTIVADGLAQLPTKNPKTFKQVISEMAATGEQGILQIAGNLKPAGPGVANSVFEYALSGITDYVTSAEGAKYAAGVREGLLKAQEKCTDNPNKAFLLTQLSRVATAKDFPVFAKYVADKSQSVPALAAIEKLPGIDAEALNLVKTATGVPHASLAKIVERRKLAGAEETLLSWLSGADAHTLNAIYDALAVVGTSKSLKALQSAAAAAKFAPDDSRALDAYFRILSKSDAKTAGKAAKALIKTSMPTATRCAGLELLLKSAGQQGAQKEIIKALADKNIQYRNTALDYAEEYAGKGIYAAVASKFAKLSTPAKADVVSWLGNHHCTAQESAVNSSVSSADSILACAAMTAAAKLGTPASLNALASQLSGKYGDVAAKKLYSYNGDIASSVNKILAENKDDAVLARALRLAGQRHIHSAFDKVAGFTSSSSQAVSAAAYEALSGVATANNYSALTGLLEKTSQPAANAKVQNALCTALAPLSPEKQYDAVASSMKSSKNPQYYYRALAQSGTDAAMGDLVKALKDPSKANAAADALLVVDKPAVIPVLQEAAKQNEGKKNQLAERSVALIEKYIPNQDQKYLMMMDAVAVKPADGVVRRVVDDFGSLNIPQALAFLNGKMGEKSFSYSAALAVKSVIGRNQSLNTGDAALKALAKANEICAARKAGGDADAGYAVDEIAGIVAKNVKAPGYTFDENAKTLAEGQKIGEKGSRENIAMAFDWKTDGEAVITLRSQPVVTLSPEGVKIPALNKSIAPRKQGEWNTIRLSLTDDRLFVYSNGETLVENCIFKEAAGLTAAKYSGEMAVTVKKGTAEIRNYNAKLTPDTKVYTLSAEEKKAGFEVLFDGRSLDKWQGNTVDYTPHEGTIYVTANYGGDGNLYTKKKYSDFIYRFEFRFLTPGVNNGIGIRTHIGTDAAYDGMEIQVLDHDDPIYADLHPYQQHGSVYGICVPKHVKFDKLGTWNVEEIRAIGDRITVTVNGQVVTDCNIREACKGHNVAPDGGTNNPYTVDHQNHPGLFNKDGYISFCGHGAGVQFRNVRILDLSKKNSKRK